MHYISFEDAHTSHKRSGVINTLTN